MASSPEYFQRLVCLQVDGVSQVLRTLLCCYVGSEANKDVGVFIRKHEAYWKKLFDQKFLNKVQLDLLIPPTGKLFDNDKLDITLLCKVLLYRRACNVSASQRDCIQALKDTRSGQSYAHAPSTGIDESTFKTTWEDVETNLMELAKNVEVLSYGNRHPHGTYQEKVKNIINDFKQSPLEKFQGKMIERIIEWIQLQNAENRRNIAMENMLEYSETYLQNQDSSQSAAARILRSSPLFNTLKDKLEYNPVALAGMDEDIVNLLAKELAKDQIKMKEEGGKCLACKVSDHDWSAVEFKHIDVLLLFVDKIDWWYWDILKRYCLDRKTLKLIMIHQDDPTRNKIKRVFRFCHFEKVKSDIFSFDEKADILKETLQKIGKHSDMPIEKCVEEFKSPIGFLQICQELLNLESPPATEVHTLFRAPFMSLATLLNDFINTSGSSTMKTSVFALFYYKGQLDSSKLPSDYDKVLLDIVATTCTTLRPVHLRKDFEKLHDFVVDHTTTKTVFLPMMYEVVAMQFAEDNPVKSIEVCKQDYLLKHVAFEQPNDTTVLVSLDKSREMIQAVAIRLYEDISILIREANDQAGVGQETADRIRRLLTNRPFNDVIDFFLERLEETSTPAGTLVDGLYFAVLHGNCDIIAQIIAGRKCVTRWDEKSKEVALAVLEAYISDKNIYDILIEGGALTILQYLADFAEVGDTISLNRLVKKIRKEDWDKTSPLVLDTLKGVMIMKDTNTCKDILENGVVFDTLFICHAVNTGDIGIIKMIVSHMETKVKQKIDPLCAELTESMVYTHSPKYKDVCKYLMKRGAMSPFKLIHTKVVDDKNFDSARDMINRLSMGKVWEGHKADIHIRDTVIWLVENGHDRQEHVTVLDAILQSGVKIVPEILESVRQTLSKNTTIRRIN